MHVPFTVYSPECELSNQKRSSVSVVLGEARDPSDRVPLKAHAVDERVGLARAAAAESVALRHALLDLIDRWIDSGLCGTQHREIV